MMGYNGVKFDETGQNMLASTYLIQLKGKQYQLVWPDKRSGRQARLADERLEALVDDRETPLHRAELGSWADLVDA